MSKGYKLLFLLLFAVVQLQAQHLYEHVYPVIHEEDARIRQMMDRVSVDSLEATIEHMQAYHTRRWDSRMVYEVQDWLYETYHDTGMDTVYLHDFQFIYRDTLRETSDNVIAIQRGVLYPEEYVVCGAHYDSYNNMPGHPDSLRAPGADDNASGSAGIIETARLLSQYKFERSIIYCGWAAEEIGLYGSAAYAGDCAAQQMDIVGYFNLDMIGYLEEGLDIRVDLVYVNRDSIIGDYVFNFCDVYFPLMDVRRGWYTPGADSDFSSFNRNGYLAIHPFENAHHSSPFIHTPNDLLGVSVNNMDQVKRFTELNVGLVATLAGPVSTSVDETSAGFTVFPNPSSGLLTVKGPEMQQLEVFNLLGQRVLTLPVSDATACTVELGSLVPGFYLVQVTQRDGAVLTEKIIIK